MYCVFLFCIQYFSWFRLCVLMYLCMCVYERLSQRVYIRVCVFGCVYGFVRTDMCMCVRLCMHLYLRIDAVLLACVILSVNVSISTGAGV